MYLRNHHRNHRSLGWWALSLLVVSGVHHPYFRNSAIICNKQCKAVDVLHNLLLQVTSSLGPKILLVDAARKCRNDRCNLDCKCKLDDPVECAAEFGKWGYFPPSYSEAEVWKNMPREYALKYGAIKPVGMRGANRVTGIGRGIGKILEISNTTLTGQVYFEIHPDQLGEPEKWQSWWDNYHPPDLIVELYGGIEFGLNDCSEDGIMLGHRLINMTGLDDAVSNFEYTVVPLDDEYNEMFYGDAIECHPRSTNGQIAMVHFTLNDPFYYNELSPSIMNLWYPFRQNLEFGVMEFCVRMEMIDPSFESQDDDFTDDYFKKKNVTSYIDTKFKVEVSAPDITNNFTRFREDFSEVKIYSNQAYTPTNDTTVFLPPRYNETEVVNITEPLVEIVVVPMTTDLCSSPWESDIPGSFGDRTFLNGKTFRLCIGPKKEYQDQYVITRFQNVVCENSGRNTTIIDENGMPDNYTTIESNTLGFTIRRGGIITGTKNEIFSISSVINSDLAGIFPEGDKYFVCKGGIVLEERIPETSNSTNTTVVQENTTTTTTRSADEDLGQRRRRAARNQRFSSRSLQENEAGQQDEILLDESGTVNNNNINITLPRKEIVGSLAIRVDITQETALGNVERFFDNSIYKVSGWFGKSSASKQATPMKQYDTLTIAVLGISVLLPFLLFT